jgi:hypothetical protein
MTNPSMNLFNPPISYSPPAPSKPNSKPQSDDNQNIKLAISTLSAQLDAYTTFNLMFLANSMKNLPSQDRAAISDMIDGRIQSVKTSFSYDAKYKETYTQLMNSLKAILNSY